MRQVAEDGRAVIEELDLDALKFLCSVLEDKVLGGAATLEDYGRLALAQQELAKRTADGQ